jgi:glucan phosphoethanolaminetransferase (alkaline phosphatase superfamily)
MALDASSILSGIDSHSGEYLFYIGGIYIALLLLARRKWLAAFAVFGIAVLWLSYFLSIAVYLESLGDDSFADAANFSMDEARFWLFTLNEAIYADFSPRKFFAYTAAAGISFYVLKFVAAKAGLADRRYVFAKLAIAATFIVLAFHHTASTAVTSYLDNSERFRITEQNFQQPVPDMAPARSGLELIVYIGESTTVMNMGLYGYPRNTTPRLGALARSDPNLLVFRDVFSTHTHTSGSLLEALSIGLYPLEDTLPIAERKRLSIVDVLAKAGVESRLISNQGMRGAWDHASSVIFRNSRNTFRIKEELTALRRGEAPPGKWDDQFFEWQLRRETQATRPTVLFLHSYAGHGHDAENIPAAFRLRVDDAFAPFAPSQVAAGAHARVVDMIEEYDSAIRYVDYSVSGAIARVTQSRKPLVLVYFSDHGEAAFSRRGHDSSRFKHEMVRIPLILYFNDVARAQAPALFARYKALAGRGDIATLGQLSSTLLDLMGTAPARAGSLVIAPVIGERTRPAPIVVRRTGQGISYVSLDPEAPTAGTDEDTRTYLAVRAGKLAAAQVCEGKPGTFEELARRILVAGCNPGRWAAQ